MRRSTGPGIDELYPKGHNNWYSMAICCTDRTRRQDGAQKIHRSLIEWLELEEYTAIQSFFGSRKFGEVGPRPCVGCSPYRLVEQCCDQQRFDSTYRKVLGSFLCQLTN
ncbi:MAG: hypothetical protein ACPGWR_08455 [Ardenticatenaceae bacterium]